MIKMKKELKRVLAAILSVVLMITGLYIAPTARRVMASETEGVMTDSKVLSVKMQTKKNSDGSYDMRVLSSVDSLDYLNVGFDVYYDGATKPIPFTATTVFKRIDAKSNVAYNFSPKVIHPDSEYFVTGTIKGINANNLDKEFYIRPFWTTLEGQKEYGQGRCFTINEAKSKTNINIPVEMKTVEKGAKVSVQLSKNGTDVFETAEAVVAKYENGYAHLNVPLTSVTDKKLLTSATMLTVAGGKTDGSDAKAVYRNLETAYVGTAASADTSWYDVATALGEKKFIIATNADLYGFAKLTNDGDASKVKQNFASKEIYLVSDITVNDETLISDSTDTTNYKKWYSYNAETGIETYSVTPKYADWKSIGTSVSFAGTFDGQMHTISGLCQPSPTARRTGLFSQTTMASHVRNLVLTNSYFNTTYNSVGSIVGYAQGDFDKLYSDALIVSSDIYAGGLFGMFAGNGSTIDDCWFNGRVENTATGVTQSGGIAGIVFISNTTMTNCLNTGVLDVSKSTQEFPKAGGFVGDSYNSNTDIVTSINAGTIKTADTAKHGGSVVGWISSGTVKSIHTYAYGADYVIGKINSGSFLVTFTSGGATTEDLNRTTNYQTVPAITKHNDESKFLGSTASTQLEVLDFANTYYTLPNHAPILKVFKSAIIDESWYNEKADTYVLSDVKDLYGLAVLSQTNNFEGKTIKLANDIEINSGDSTKWATTAPYREWMPIGTTTCPFAGTFDGQMHTIRGLYIDAPNANIGLFGVTSDKSAVKNLTLTNSYVASTGTNLGSIAGQGNGLFDTVKSEAIVNGSKAAVGGIVGQANSAKVVMQYCWFDGTVTNNGNSTSNRGTGGMIGVLETGATAQIKSSLNSGAVKAEQYTTVQGTSNVYPFAAGFVGYVKGSNSVLSIENSLHTGDVSVNEAATGCYGLFVGFEAKASTSTNNYTTTPESWTEANEIKENYNPKKHTVVATTEITGDAAKTKLTNFDFGSTWSTVANGTPILNFTSNYGEQDTRWFNANASQYVLYDAGDLYGFRSLSATNDFAQKTVKLGRDIVVNEGKATIWATQASSKSWTPIGAFSGTFDGGGHVISGLYLNTTTKHAGFFSTTNASSVVKNLYLKNSYFTSTGENLGSIAGCAQGTIDCVYSDAVVVTTGGIRTGGFVGMGYGSSFTLNKCWFAGSVKNTTSDINKRGTGGFVGVLLDGGKTKITNCLNAGTVDLRSYTYKQDGDLVVPVAGGIVGWHGKNAEVDITSCVNTGKIQVSDKATDGYNSILGLNKSGKAIITDCYATTESCKDQDKSNIAAGCITWVAEADIKGSEAETTMGLLDWENNWKSHENAFPTVVFSATASAKATDLQQKIASNATLNVSTATTFELTSPSGVKIPYGQGGCTDGTYYYQAFITYKDEKNENNNKVKILKHDLTGTVSDQWSAELPLNHGNDMTYNSKMNSLIVCHNAGAANKITFVDPDTLEITGSKILDFNIYSIDYNEATNRYVVGISKGEEFYVLNSEFEKVYAFASKEDLRPDFIAKTNMTQGICCDQNYIYCVLSNDNVIVVYDWFGNYKSLISLDAIAKTIEPENISVVGNTIYVGTWTETNASTTVYKIELTDFATAE